MYKVHEHDSYNFIKENLKYTHFDISKTKIYNLEGFLL